LSPVPPPSSCCLRYAPSLTTPLVRIEGPGKKQLCSFLPSQFLLSFFFRCLRRGLFGGVFPKKWKWMFHPSTLTASLLFPPLQPCFSSTRTYVTLFLAIVLSPHPSVSPIRGRPAIRTGWTSLLPLIFPSFGSISVQEQSFLGQSLPRRSNFILSSDHFVAVPFIPFMRLPFFSNARPFPFCDLTRFPVNRRDPSHLLSEMSLTPVSIYLQSSETSFSQFPF